MNRPQPLFHVVLFQPEIPENTGAIGRTCVGVGAKLWLVRPLGFQVDHRRLKRAGLDYWPNLDWEIADDWNDLLNRLSDQDPAAAASAASNSVISDSASDASSMWTRPFPRPFWLLSKRGVANYTSRTFKRGDVFVFGAESTGLPAELMSAHPESCLRIPILPGIRSLNLSVSVGITLFEARRQVFAG